MSEKTDINLELGWKCQKCEEEFDTEKELQEHFKKSTKTGGDSCPECCHELTDREWITEGNEVPWGSTYAVENVVVGFQCRECGHEESW